MKSALSWGLGGAGLGGLTGYLPTHSDGKKLTQKQRLARGGVGALSMGLPMAAIGHSIAPPPGKASLATRRAGLRKKETEVSKKLLEETVKNIGADTKRLPWKMKPSTEKNAMFAGFFEELENIRGR